MLGILAAKNEHAPVSRLWLPLPVAQATLPAGLRRSGGPGPELVPARSRRDRVRVPTTLAQIAEHFDARRILVNG